MFLFKFHESRINLLFLVHRVLALFCHYWRNFYTIAAITSKIDSSRTRKNLDTFQKAFEMPQRVDFCCSGPLAVAVVVAAVAAIAVVVVAAAVAEVLEQFCKQRLKMFPKI